MVKNHRTLRTDRDHESRANIVDDIVETAGYLLQQSRCCLRFLFLDNGGLIFHFSVSIPMPSVRYSAEFRTAAVSRLLSSNSSVAQVARDLGCSMRILGGFRWAALSPGIGSLI